MSDHHSLSRDEIVKSDNDQSLIWEEIVPDFVQLNF